MTDNHIFQLDRISELVTEIALLKRDVTFLTTLLEKMDTIIVHLRDKHSESEEKAGVLIEKQFVRNQETLSALENSIHSRLTNIESMFSTEVQHVNTTLTDHIKQEENLEYKFNRLLWTGGGSAAVAIWVISNFDWIRNFFK